jgi:hypothetical protein
LRAITGATPENISQVVSRILLASEPVPAGVRRALGLLFAGKEPGLVVELKRRDIGRPKGTDRDAPNPAELEQFIQDALSRGELHKNAVADAVSHFRISRASVYRLRKKFRDDASMQVRSDHLAEATIPRPGGPHKARNKRAKQRQKRAKANKSQRQLKLANIPHPERYKKRRKSHLSPKRRLN